VDAAMSLERAVSVDRVLNLARDRSVAGRERLATAVADLYHEHRSNLQAAEYALMLDIFHRLVSDVEQSVRAALARQLANTPEAPPEIIRALAEDIIDVARMVLLHSPVLTDPDLVEIIEHRSLQHRLTIALRQPLSAPVCDALVQSGVTPLQVATLENHQAVIRPATMALLVERARTTPELHQPLVNRHDLDPVLGRRLANWVSRALREQILARFKIPAEAIDKALAASVNEVLGNRGPTDAGAAAELAEYLAGADAITPSLYVQVMRLGDVTLFEALFARQTGISSAKVRRMIYEPSGRSLATLCKATGIGKPDFASMFVFVRSCQPTLPPLDAKTLTSVLAFFDNTNPNGAKATLNFIHREPERAQLAS
jgi:uncharacterized protein (DUF2336 family)